MEGEYFSVEGWVTARANVQSHGEKAQQALDTVMCW